MGQLYPGEFGCVGLSGFTSELSLDVAISSSLVELSLSIVPAGGFLAGSGTVFFATTGLDENLRSEREEGRL